MNILIFGASGDTGHNLVVQALKHQHSVTAFVRNSSKLSIHHDRVRIVEGDVTNYQAVEEAIENQEAVLSALGASNPFKRNFKLIDGIQNITTAMTRRNVKRLIYQSFLGVKENRKELGFLINTLLPIALKNIIHDHEAKENIITNGNLQWTIVRCPMLTNGPFTGSYRDGEHITSSSMLPSISRANVADFMLKQLSESKYVLKKPRIMH
jgi:putative NADH-flavin reductase